MCLEIGSLSVKARKFAYDVSIHRPFGLDKTVINQGGLSIIHLSLVE